MTNTKFEIKVADFERKNYEMNWAPLQNRLIHGAMGVSGEAGEVSELIKKHVFYGKELSRAKVTEEVGDVLYYLSVVLSSVGSSLDEAMEANIKKLSARYSAGYSDEAALKRVDMQPFSKEEREYLAEALNRVSANNKESK